MSRALDSLATFHADVRRVVLENGVTVILKPDPSAPVVSVQVWVGVGSIHEGGFLGSGLSHYMEHMIFKGTPSRPVGKITREINDAGGSVNAYTSFDRTVFHADMPSEAWTVGLDVLADAVMNAAIPDAEWQNEKAVVIREVAMGHDDPERVADQLLWRTAYREHPYRFPVIGYEPLLARVTRDDLLAFFHGAYVPDRMIVVVAGDIDLDRAEAAVRERFAPFSRPPGAPFMTPDEPGQAAPRLARQTGDYGITRLKMAWHTVALAHEDAVALDVLACVVGSGRSSRLVRNLVERSRVVDAISAGSYTPKCPGLFVVEAAMRPEKEADAVAALDAEVESWTRKGFSDDEIGKARRILLNNELVPLQTAHGQADLLASGEFYGGSPAFSQTYLRRLEAVTAADIRRVAERYLRAENRTTIVLAPAALSSNAVAAAAVLPGPVRKQLLANGAVLLTREDRRLPYVSFCAVFRGGVLFETENLNGATRLMAELMTRGTETRTSEAIAEALERLGADLSPFSGLNSFGVQGRCFATDADSVLRIAADCLLRSSFPQDEIDKQKAIQCSAIQQQQERPFFHAQQALSSLLFAGHPYRMDPLGTVESVSALSRDDLLALWRRHVVSGNMVLAIFGDIGGSEAKAMADALFFGLRRDMPPAPAFADEPAGLPLRKEVRLPREQAIVLQGYRGVSLADPRRDALEVLQSALSGLSSRLAADVREARGLAYYVGAYERLGPDTGSFVLYAGTRPDAAGQVEALMAAEADRICSAGPDPDEVERARRQIVAAQAMALQDNLGLAQGCALDELLGVGYVHCFTTAERMARVTPADVRAAAAQLFTPERKAVAVVLPESKEPTAPPAPQTERPQR